MAKTVMNVNRTKSSYFLNGDTQFCATEQNCEDLADSDQCLVTDFLTVTSNIGVCRCN